MRYLGPGRTRGFWRTHGGLGPGCREPISTPPAETIDDAAWRSGRSCPPLRACVAAGPALGRGRRDLEAFGGPAQGPAVLEHAAGQTQTAGPPPRSTPAAPPRNRRRPGRAAPRASPPPGPASIHLPCHPFRRYRPYPHLKPHTGKISGQRTADSSAAVPPRPGSVLLKAQPWGWCRHGHAGEKAAGHGTAHRQQPGRGGR